MHAERRPSARNKFSATRIHAKFNDRVYLDLFYWGGAWYYMR